MFSNFLEKIIKPLEKIAHTSTAAINLGTELEGDHLDLQTSSPAETPRPHPGKKIDRYGQQVDGYWVVGECQDSPDAYRQRIVKYYTPEGLRISESDSPWYTREPNDLSIITRDNVRERVFCPMQAPEDPSAICELIQTASQGNVDNFLTAIFSMGWVVGCLQAWHKERQTGDRSFPLLNLYGAGSRSAREMALSLIGSEWMSLAVSAKDLDREGINQLVKTGSHLGSLAIAIDSSVPYDNISIEELRDMIRALYHRDAIQLKSEIDRVHSGILIFSAQPCCGYGEDTELQKYVIQCPVFTETEALVPMQLLEKASASFPRFIALGWQSDGIAEFEQSLCHRLEATPETQLKMGKLADLAIVGHYARVLLEMANTNASILDWLVKKNQDRNPTVTAANW
ncbi:MAG TPA: hypothetical protein IGS17_09740 [Oscillatoriales cyanobacterium M59_W2019_021]|nr:hypothetical protein [Oscillatoriales cyanobacterium M4454_W2019_049]HIK51189.1 hypothetical protein [Oscillatoriales cyanobacterium M59_W2019_021]